MAKQGKRRKAYAQLVPDWRERYQRAHKKTKPFVAFWLRIAGVSDKELSALESKPKARRGARETMSIQIPDPCMNTECAWFGLRHLDNCVPLVPPPASSVPSDFEDRVEWPPAPTPETPRNGLNSPTPKQIRKGYADAMKQIEPFIGKATQPSTPATDTPWSVEARTSVRGNVLDCNRRRLLYDVQLVDAERIVAAVNGEADFRERREDLILSCQVERNQREAYQSTAHSLSETLDKRDKQIEALDARLKEADRLLVIGATKVDCIDRSSDGDSCNCWPCELRQFLPRGVPPMTAPQLDALFVDVDALCKRHGIRLRRVHLRTSGDGEA